VNQPPKARKGRQKSDAAANPSLAEVPDGLWSCCFQEPPTLWGLLLLLITISTAWSLRQDRSAWPVPGLLLGITLLLLGSGFRRGRRAERLARGQLVVEGGRSFVRAVVADLAPIQGGGWRFSYRAGGAARQETYLQRPPESVGDVGEAELLADAARWRRPAWRNRFLSDADLCFDAGPQARKVRFLTLLALACAVGACAWGCNLASTWGLAPADGGALKPLWARLLLGGGMAAAGLGFGLAMVGYALRYVTTLRRAGADALELETLLGGRRSLARADLGLGPFHEGHGRTLGWILFVPVTAIRVAAPWRTVFVRGVAGSFILDLQGAISEDLFPSHPSAGR
jgi:hypothetical protein